MSGSDELLERLAKLERTVLELGAEVFGLKGALGKCQESQEQLLAIFNGLKQLLDERGLITREDFDAAIELGEALEHFQSLQEHAAHGEIERLKKISH